MLPFLLDFVSTQKFTLIAIAKYDLNSSIRRSFWSILRKGGTHIAQTEHYHDQMDDCWMISDITASFERLKPLTFFPLTFFAFKFKPETRN